MKKELQILKKSWDIREIKTLEEFKKGIILKRLKKYNTVHKAALSLGMNPSTLYKYLDRHKIAYEKRRYENNK